MFGLGRVEQFFVLLLVFLILAVLVPAVQAKRRGYSLIVWFIAGALVFNPIYLLVILGISPHRKRQQMREQFRRELDAKLAAAGIPAAAPATRPMADRSLGDQPTIPPGTAAATDGPPVPQRSLGDLPTVSPGSRSVGDEPTRA